MKDIKDKLATVLESVGSVLDLAPNVARPLPVIGENPVKRVFMKYASAQRMSRSEAIYVDMKNLENTMRGHFERPGACIIAAMEAVDHEQTKKK